MDRKRAYIAFSLLAYYLCAINPHIIGATEFGFEPWLDMALVWGGIFIWPIFFLPFALLALYRPLAILVEFAINSTNFKDRLRYLSPYIATTMLAILATTFDAVPTNNYVPWEIKPILGGAACATGVTQGGASLTPLSSYDKTGSLRTLHADAYWLKNKCWPNAFFYLTVPIRKSMFNEDYKQERPTIQRAYISAFGPDRGIARSKTFWAYVISIFVLFWLGISGIVMSIFFMASDLRRPRDNSIVKAPSEDAYLCLTYSFIILMLWIPFRMNTIYSKKLYFCAEFQNCTLGPKVYFPDMIMWTMMAIGFAYLTAGLFVKYQRIVLSILGLSVSALIVFCGVAVLIFGHQMAELASMWEFYVGVSIPFIVLLFALWFQFDPASVRFNDFRREMQD